MRGEHPRISRRSWPDGWEAVRLEKAGRWLSGGTPSTSNDDYWGGDIPWISSASLKEFRVGKSDRMVTKLGALNGTRLVPEGTVMFVVRGMSLNNEFRIGVTERRVAFGQDCKAIIPTEGIDSTFLAYAIKVQSSKILRMVETTSHGTGRLDTQRLGKLEVGVPLLDEQRRIVAAVAAVSRDIEALELRIRKLLVLRDSSVEQILERISVGEGRPIGKCGSVRSGKQLSPSSVSRGEQLPYLRVANVLNGSIDFNDVNRMYFTKREQESLLLRPGDILLNEGQSLELVGRSAIFRGRKSPMFFQNTLIRFRPHEDLMSEYAQIIFSRWLRFGEFSRIAKQTTSIAHLGADRFARMEFPYIPIAAQREAVKAFARVNARVVTAEAKLVKLKIIRDALAEDLLSGRVRVTDL
ncbi:restriction endonuclease subunit S [Streptosporangium sandarakinum]|uniref:restriction endonuclease subunit S n=1 Tax=Streptosporangium sandarakinum TaxID=1260955 RepID=UPI0036BCC9DF